MSDDTLYKINDDFFLKMDSQNFILVKRSIIEKEGKTKGNEVFAPIAFFPPSQYGITLMYSKFMSLNMSNSKTTDLKSLKKELNSYYSQFVDFVLRFNTESPIKNLATMDPKQKDIIEEQVPIKKKRKKLLKRRKK